MRSCSSEKKIQRDNKKATMICVECQEKLCAECAENHTIQRLSSTHKLIALGEKPAADDLANTTKCEKHLKEEL